MVRITIDIDNTIIKKMEIYPSNTLEINTSLTEEKEKKLLASLRKHTTSFASNYKDMKGSTQIYIPIIFTSRKIANPLDNIKGGWTLP